jgi:hypothetical protein
MIPAGSVAYVDSDMPVFKSDYSSALVVGQRITIVRSTIAYQDADAVAKAFAELFVCLDPHDRKSYRLLVDQKRVRGSNTPEFERAIGAFRPRLLGDWLRTVVLVQTPTLAAGKSRRQTLFHECLACDILARARRRQRM